MSPIASVLCSSCLLLLLLLLCLLSGGRDDATELSSAERFNPQTNTWQPVVAMTSRRSGVNSINIVLTN